MLVTRSMIAAVSERLAVWVEQGWQEHILAALLNINLWGNRADLSLWPADAGEDQPLQAHWQGAEEHTLVDDTVNVVRYLQGSKPGRVDFIVDNAGLELVTDLALADYLLASGTAEQVRLNLKMHPTFVSDAMIIDAQGTVRFLLEAENGETRSFGERLKSYLDDSRLLLSDHPFWTSPLAFWQLPSVLVTQPNSAMWWYTRLLWLLVYTLATLPFLLVFARFERPRIDPAARPPAVWRQILGCVVACAGLAQLALDGVGGEGWLGLRWIPLLLPLAGAGIAGFGPLGMLARGRQSRPGGAAPTA